jgi:hypothetical protein
MSLYTIHNHHNIRIIIHVQLTQHYVEQVLNKYEIRNGLTSRKIL